jgi:protein-S-isoprenylcysteine O-methyltransferase Ste14
MKDFLKNYISTTSFILLAYFFYSQINFYQNFLIKNFSFRFVDLHFSSLIIYKIIILLYIIFLIPFYIFFTNKSKARIIINYILIKIKNIKYKISKKEQVSILAWIVKLFFAPLMIIWLTDHIVTTVNNIYLSYRDISLLTTNFYIFFNKHFFFLFLTLILFFDVLFFTLWYLIESPKLKNNIKSVDATFLWWFVVLICYPPFNTYTTNIIWWYSAEFPHFNNMYIHIILNMSILILMWIYTRASISLWLKASNLTNRWIVKKWPYKYIRHPAYIAKNLSWWIWWLPLLIWNIYTSQYKHFFIVLFSLIAWSSIYYLRAITEEKHLSKDDDYKAYKKIVKYKFIPKIF